MSMDEVIRQTAEQFGFEPKVENGEALGNKSKYVVVGMGGSHLAAGLVKMWLPQLDMVSWRNYGLPKIADLKERLIILSSYSGNTEEVIEAYVQAGKMGLARVVIASGGKLLELAKSERVAYVQLPNLGIQPRSALPVSLLAFLKALGQEEMLAEVKQLEQRFEPSKLESKGKELAERIKGKVPVIYSSAENEILGYVWKIVFNETGKIPAFANVVPELNHNEMNGFDVKPATTKLSDNFYFLFLMDGSDQVKVRQRMELTARLYKERNLLVEMVELEGDNRYLKFFNARAVADFTAYFTATNYGLEAEQVPMVEEFKKML